MVQLKAVLLTAHQITVCITGHLYTMYICRVDTLQTSGDVLCINSGSVTMREKLFSC